jgi:hypothetical protein
MNQVAELTPRNPHMAWGPVSWGVHILDPQTEEIDLEDIGRALAGILRWCGRGPTTVLQHSLELARRVESPEETLHALLHDAAEAFLGDIPRPFKNEVPGYDRTEVGILAAIYRSLDCPWPSAEAVAQVRFFDDQLADEERQQRYSASTGAAFGNSGAVWAKSVRMLAEDMRRG